MAQVNVETWQEAYRGIVPQPFLDALPQSLQEMEERWRVRIAHLHPAATFVALDGEHQVVGYAAGGRTRDGDQVYPAEIYALYVRPGFQGRGLGGELFDALCRHFAREGLPAMKLWALADNPYRRFYERRGGALIGSKMLAIGGKELTTVAYGWNLVPREAGPAAG